MIARDLSLTNLTAILLSLSMVIAPHSVHLPTWIPALVAIVLLARFYAGWQHKKLPNKWLLIAIAMACTAGIALSYRTLYGRDVGVAMLTVMMALKVMEMSTPRDTMVVVLLAYFLVVTNFFYSQSIPTALYLGMGWLIVVAIKPLSDSLSASQIAWIFAGGLLYTAGVPFYIWKSRKYTHAVWHLFILGGVACHFFAVLSLVSGHD